MQKKTPVPEPEVFEAAEAEDMHSGEVAKGTIFGLIGNLFLKFISFVYTIYLARAVAQEDVGLFNLALAIIGVVTVWKDFGLSTALIRYIPFFESRKEYGKVRALVSSTYAINVAVGILLVALVWIGADFAGHAFKSDMLPDAIRALALVSLADNVFKTNLGFFQGRMDIKSLQMVSNLQNVLKLAFTVALVQIYGPTIFAICAGYIASFFAASAITAPRIISSLRKLPGDDKVPLSQLASEIVPFGIMLTILQTFNVLISYLDKALIGYLLPASVANAQVAVYTIASNFALTLTIFPSTVGAIFLPMISKLLGHDNQEAMKRTVSSSQRWVLMLTIPASAVLMAYSAEMLQVFFGNGYASGGTTMALFILGLSFSLITYTFSLVLAAMRLVSLELKIAMAVAAVNVALNVALIPSYGIEGAAFAGAASFAFSSILFAHFAWKRAGMRIGSDSLKLFLLGVVAYGIAIMSKQALAAAYASMPSVGIEAIQPYFSKITFLAMTGAVLAVAYVAYGIFAIAFKCLGHEDISVMKKIARRASAPQWAVDFAEKTMRAGLHEGGKTT